MRATDTDAAADGFFAREVTPALRERVLAEGGTPSILLARWERDCARARAVDAEATKDIRARERREASRRGAVTAARNEADRVRSRERAREWAAAHPQDAAERHRRWAAANPERAREQSRAYYAAHKEEIAARAKERRRLDPAGQAQWGRNYRAAHKEEIARKARETRQDPETKRRRAEYERNRRRRERLRRDGGLPPNRLYHLSKEELLASGAEADAFFARTRTADEVQHLREADEERTPPDLWNEWVRECAAIRRAARAIDDAANRPAPAPTTAQLAHVQRQEAIARAINDRLRVTPRRRDPFLDSPAAPHTVPGAARARGVAR